ncbi:hypothetical protein EVAR_101803_1 [Eumeta japonica]|uniref:Uncharacterized protein n=1 Tax=Eumeta variegata TaxID=151549 RepID=A0A4C1SQG1_EUMVA|nr:hypothetical protein EVAR_101803_1 [Eumeta japonica]
MVFLCDSVMWWCRGSDDEAKRTPTYVLPAQLIIPQPGLPVALNSNWMRLGFGRFLTLQRCCGKYTKLQRSHEVYLRDVF